MNPSSNLSARLVFTKAAIKFTFAPDSETPTQRQYNGYFLIFSINEHLETDKTIATRKLPNGDIIIIFDSETSKKQTEKS